MKSQVTFLILFLSISFSSVSQDFNYYISKGDSCREIRKFNDAIIFYKKAFSIKPARIIQNEDEVTILRKIANSYYEIAEYQTSIKYLLNFLDKDVVKNNDSLKSIAYNEIGNCYDIINQDQKALKYFNKSIEYAGTDTIRIGGAYNNIANIYRQNQKLDTARIYYNKAYNLFQLVRYYKYEIVVLMNLAIIEEECKNWNAAFEYYTESKKMAEAHSDTLNLILINLNLGAHYIEQKDFNTAKQLLNWSLEQSIKKNSRFLLMHSYNSLVNLYESSGNYKESLKYHKLFKASSDSINDLNTNKEISELELKYSLKEKENEYEILEQKMIIKEVQLKNQKSYNWILIIVIFFSAFFLVFFFFQRLKLSKSKKTLENKQKELLKSQKQLEDLNYQFEKLIIKYEKVDS
jgi:tetratricopeptide (TPR) repeat protein